MERINRTQRVLEQISWEPKVLQKEIAQKNKVCVLLAGPSCVGKTSIISKMLESDLLFATPTQVTTRSVRDGQSDKITVTEEEFDRLKHLDDFFHRGSSYHNQYGTLKSSVDSIAQMGKVAVLDFPLHLVSEIKALNPEYDFLVFYLVPKSISEWYTRMANANRNSISRIKYSLKEYSEILSTENDDITAFIENPDGYQHKALDQILETISNAIGDT